MELCTCRSFFSVQVFFSELKFWYRFPYKKHIAELLLKNNFSDTYAVKVNYFYPLFGRNDLFVYIKAFSGYGESLIDYNHKIEKVGIGFSTSR